RRREPTGAVIHLDDSESLARDVGQLLAEEWLHDRPFADGGRSAQRGHCEGEPRRDGQTRQCLRRAARGGDAWLPILLSSSAKPQAALPSRCFGGIKNGPLPLGRPNRPRYLVELPFLDIGPIDWRPSQSP